MRNIRRSVGGSERKRSDAGGGAPQDDLPSRSPTPLRSPSPPPPPSLAPSPRPPRRRRSRQDEPPPRRPPLSRHRPDALPHRDSGTPVVLPRHAAPPHRRCFGFGYPQPAAQPRSGITAHPSPGWACPIPNRRSWRGVGGARDPPGRDGGGAKREQLWCGGARHWLPLRWILRPLVQPLQSPRPAGKTIPSTHVCCLLCTCLLSGSLGNRREASEHLWSKLLHHLY